MLAHFCEFYSDSSHFLSYDMYLCQCGMLCQVLNRHNTYVSTTNSKKKGDKLWRIQEKMVMLLYSVSCLQSLHTYEGCVILSFILLKRNI